ncbi:MAG: response regulator [Deltaproteobacteria bacterium]|nr:response regulator [Deltaproteobacteria bacterium]
MALRVLTVDDSPIMRRVIAKSISMCGLDISVVDEAVDGLDALKKLKERNHDVIFADINMPRMNGVEFVRALNEDQELRELPVFIVSTDRSLSRREELAALGVKAQVTKPFRPETFRMLLESVFPAEKEK